jgi:S-adenosylmethionine hydrolase
VVVRAGDHALVGPDNGVLLPAARRLAGGDGIDVFEIDLGDPASSTFHGRDVFAPAAALVHEAGVDAFEAEAAFTQIEEWDELTFPEPTVEDGHAAGEILVVDGFGNAITNVPGEVLDGRYGGQVAVDGERVPVEPTYAAVDPGQRLVTVGSHENVELAVNRGRGEAAFDVAVGDTVSLDVD